MKKKVFGRKLGRSRPAREALFTSLSRAMILGGKITTTRAKAKSMQGFLEKLITEAKKGGINARRRVLSRMDNDRKTVDILFSGITKMFTARKSGYTRLIALSVRKGDGASMVRMEWTETLTVGKKKDEKNISTKTKRS